MHYSLAYYVIDGLFYALEINQNLRYGLSEVNLLVSSE